MMENDNKIIATIQKLLPNVKAIYRFGSSGTKYERPESDVDIAILPAQKLDSSTRWELMNVIAQSLQKDSVDLVDLSQAPTVLRFHIIDEGRRIWCLNQMECDLFETTALSDYVRLNEERSEILDAITKRGQVHDR